MSQKDIVERLRESGSQDCMRGEPWRSQVKDEAADTITQLRERLDEVEKRAETQSITIGQHQQACVAAGLDPCIGVANCIDQLRLSNERLREALGKIEKATNESQHDIGDVQLQVTRAWAIAHYALTAESGT